MKSLPLAYLREVLDFVRFLRLRRSIDPDQAYFWTRKWQSKERAVERDKRHGRIIGDGTVRGLARALGR
ncbi:MAG: hypothetical protein HY748_18555 [Elusimicrobia bacterium]|nr:hypothetical protein [Elusimicrobiota bacterium]